jgi:hypothetical protein
LGTVSCDRFSDGSEDPEGLTACTICCWHAVRLAVVAGRIEREGRASHQQHKNDDAHKDLKRCGEPEAQAGQAGDGGREIYGGVLEDRPTRRFATFKQAISRTKPTTAKRTNRPRRRFRPVSQVLRGLLLASVPVLPNRRLGTVPPNVEPFETPTPLPPLQHEAACPVQDAVGPKKARHRQLSVFIRQLQEFKQVKSLRQIALKDLRQIILKATPDESRRVRLLILVWFSPSPHCALSLTRNKVHQGCASLADAARNTSGQRASTNWNCFTISLSSSGIRERTRSRNSLTERSTGSAIMYKRWSRRSASS